MLPEVKSAPLAICAFIILSVSSSKVGIKRRAMVIIIANSWAGSPIFLKGLSSLSIPSVKAMGEVVKVNNDETTIKKTSLIVIKSP